MVNIVYDRVDWGKGEEPLADTSYEQGRGF